MNGTKLLAKNTRIGEIDLIRSFAIILMILFHIIVDLKDFYGYPVEYLYGFWFYVGKLSAILFIFTAGISATFSSAPLNHGFKIFVWGMVLTVITYLYNPQTYIRFGILHLLGTSILSYPLLKQLSPAVISVTGLFLLGIGLLFTPITLDIYYLFPFGIVADSFQSIDYYPLIPWYGIFLLGSAVGKSLYRNKISLLLTTHFRPITWLSRHSLVIYLVHQPILLTVLYLTH